MVYVAMHAISDRDLEQTVLCKPSHLQYDIEMAKRIFFNQLHLNTEVERIVSVTFKKSELLE
jgi:hypothetical protein